MLGAARSSVSRQLLLALSVIATTTTAAGVTLADNASCVNAAEEGQRDRGAGKLRSAQKRFVVCADPSCPIVVQRDCAKWASEVSDATPTIVIDARDKDNHDIADVAITIDGESIGTMLDGKAIAVDPGSHVVVGQRAKDGERVTQTILAKEGVKARPVRLVFGDAKAASAPADAATTKSETAQGHSVVPWLVVGLGAAAVVAGVVVILTAPALPPNCSDQDFSCRQTPGETAQQFEEDRDQARQHTNQPIIGLIAGGLGVALAAGGLVWHFLEPTGPSKSAKATRFAPWIGHGSGGLTLSGSL